MTAPFTSSPAPRQLSDVERALWEKATEIQALNARERLESPACYRIYEFKPDPAVILSLLTALSSEREAGERWKRIGAERLTVSFNALMSAPRPHGSRGPWSCMGELFTGYGNSPDEAITDYDVRALTSTETPDAR